jgi:predicted secreted protein
VTEAVCSPGRLRVGGRTAVAAQAKDQQRGTDWDAEWSNAMKLMEEGATVTVKVEVRAPQRLGQGGQASGCWAQRAVAAGVSQSFCRA